MESMGVNGFLRTNPNGPSRHHVLESDKNIASRYHVDTQKLKAAREAAGLTVAELAAAADVDECELALIERRGCAPTLTTLRSITLTLRLPAYTVIEWA